MIKAATKRFVKNPIGTIKDAAKATAKFVVKHKDTLLEVAAIGGAILAGVACTAVTAGVGAVACMVGAGALINLAKDAAQGDIHNIGDALGSMGTGALSGLVGGAGGMIAGKVGTMVASKAGTGLVGRLSAEAAENGVGEVFNQAVTTGRVDVKSAALGMIPGLGALDRKAKGGGGGGGGGLTSAVGLNLVSVGGGGGGCKNSRPPRKHSFEPDTKVLMADGSSRPIEDVNVGDKVVATDPETGKSKSEPVTELHRNTDRELSDVTVKDQNGKASVLNTTQNHPFWNETDKKWSDAKDLKPGDELKVAGQGEVVVAKVRNYDGAKEMRDLTVNDIHTYYVVADNEPVLVHNNDRTARFACDSAGVTTDLEYSVPTERYNRKKQYGGAQTNGPAGRAARKEGENQPCPVCQRPMVSGTDSAPIPEHEPALMFHYYLHGGKDMSNSDRRTEAREGINGAVCRRCQNQQGAEMAAASRQIAEAFGLT